MRFRFLTSAISAALVAGAVAVCGWTLGVAAPTSGSLLADKSPSAVPVDTERGHGKSRLRITEQHVAALEAACDEQGERLAPLTSFVLSGGTPRSAALHMARTVCRGAERHVVALRAEAPVNPQALSYLNRLSDLLFILARVHNDEGRGDVLWQPGSSLA